MTVVGYAESGVSTEENWFFVDDVCHAIVAAIDVCGEIDDALRIGKMFGVDWE